MKRKGKAKFRVGQVVRIVAIYDVHLPCYARITAKNSNSWEIERVMADRVETVNEEEKYLRPLTSRERGERKKGKP